MITIVMTFMVMLIIENTGDDTMMIIILLASRLQYPFHAQLS